MMLRTVVRVASGLALMLLSCTLNAQQPLVLDTTFRASFQSQVVADVLPQEDGTVIISGQIHYPGSPIPTAHAGLARLNADGSWDDSFPWSSLGQGKMVPWEDRFYIASTTIIRRVLYSGANDLSFTMSNALGLFTPLQGGDYHVFPDGRVVMSGLHTLSDTARGFVGYHNFIWFTNTGHLDTTLTHRKGNGELSTFKQLPDGKFIASGTCTVYDGRPTSWIQRMHPDGSLDTTFFTGVNWGRAFTYLPLNDGRVYAGGLFRIMNNPDTLFLVRFMQDGSLDPTFHNDIHFERGQLSGVDAIVYGLHELAPDRLLVTGRFITVDGEPRSGIAFLDSTGTLLDLGASAGCGPYVYQGFTYGTIGGAVPYGEDGFFLHGAYHGFNDGITNDPLQRFISRVSIGDLNVSMAELRQPSKLLRLHPNPTQALVAVDYDLQPNAANAQLLVKDGTGRVIHSQRLSAPRGQVVLDTRAWAKGLYTLELLQDGMRTQVEKLVVQ